MFRKGDRVRHTRAAALDKWGGFAGVGVVQHDTISRSSHTLVLFAGGRNIKICMTDWLILAETHDPFNQIVADYCRKELGHV